MRRWAAAGLGVGLAISILNAATAGPVQADGEVCILNEFEVAWVHPGVTFYLDESPGACAGESLTLKEMESGCFETAPVRYDGSWHLSALDATTAKCLEVCPMIRPQTRIVFSNSTVYACRD